MHVGAVRVARIVLDPRAVGGEVDRARVVDADHDVRVADVDRRRAIPGDVVRRADARLAHLDRDPVRRAREHARSDRPGARLDGRRGEAVVLVEIAPDAAHPVAAHLRVAAVGVDDAQPRVEALRRLHEQHTVGADAAFAVAHRARERDGIGDRRDALVDQHELVARPVRLHDRDAGGHGATASLSSGTSDAADRAVRRDRRDGVLVDQVRLLLVLEHDGERIEALHHAFELKAVDQVDRDGNGLALHLGKVRVLERLRTSGA